MPNPTDPKVVVAGAAAGVAGAVVVLIMNLINREPMDQAALQTVIAGAVTFVFGYVGGWLKATPLPTLADRFAANKEIVSARTSKEAGHVDVVTVLVMFAVAIVVLALYVLLLRA
jgi:hypothetical protein